MFLIQDLSISVKGFVWNMMKHYKQKFTNQMYFCLQGDNGAPGPAGVPVSINSSQSKWCLFSGFVKSLMPIIFTAVDAMQWQLLTLFDS